MIRALAAWTMRHETHWHDGAGRHNFHYFGHIPDLKRPNLEDFDSFPCKQPVRSTWPDARVSCCGSILRKADWETMCFTQRGNRIEAGLP